MEDQELSTRDLAEKERGEPTGEAGERTEETTPADEPLSHERSEEGTRAVSESESPRDEREPLLPSDQSESFTSRWREIQTGFVDEPRGSVAQADALVAELMQQLATGFSQEREQLEAQWDRGDDVSTEDLRVALTRYRSFFDRLLSA
jgi:hypothetical protein